MEETKGHLIEPVTGTVKEDSDIEAAGLTGTGLIAALSLAIKTGLMKNIPELPNGKLILGDGVTLTEKDIKEAGKAIGAIRAVQLTLIVESGIEYQDLYNVYMSGASGTYVDADKAREIGSCPNFAKRIVQFGNTSISLARDLVIDDSKLNEVIELAHKIKADHHMMATSNTFKDFYSCELAYWEEGMPFEQYNQFLEIYGYPKIPEINNEPIKEKRVSKDIEDVGTDGINIIDDIGIKIEESAVGCFGCSKCEKECPENSIIVIKKGENYFTNYTTHKCLGTSCRRCVRACPVNAIQYRDIKVMSH
jgi:methylamine methyltransferase corrinoid activation protein